MADLNEITDRNAIQSKEPNPLLSSEKVNKRAKKRRKFLTYETYVKKKKRPRKKSKDPFGASASTPTNVQNKGVLQSNKSPIQQQNNENKKEVTSNDMQQIINKLQESHILSDSNDKLSILERLSIESDDENRVNNKSKGSPDVSEDGSFTAPKKRHAKKRRRHTLFYDTYMKHKRRSSCQKNTSKKKLVAQNNTATNSSKIMEYDGKDSESSKVTDCDDDDVCSSSYHGDDGDDEYSIYDIYNTTAPQDSDPSADPLDYLSSLDKPRCIHNTFLGIPLPSKHHDHPIVINEL